MLRKGYPPVKCCRNKEGNIVDQSVSALDGNGSFCVYFEDDGGGLAQLGERDNGIVEVGGSNPPSSTTLPF